MRDLPGLSGDLTARASDLVVKARTAREQSPLASPKASIATPKVRDGVATLRLYDYIDSDGEYWGISADEFAQALDDIETDVTQIELRINSGGGAVWDGLAILNTLRSQGVPVRAVVDGIAASAASFIAVACDEVVMMPNSRMMIHDALGICVGQATDMREYADFLSESSDNIAEIYAAKAGGTAEQWRNRMTAKGLLGQWYSAQEAVDAGLADSVGSAASAPVDNTPKAKTEAPEVSEPARNERQDRYRETRARLAGRRHGFA